MTTTSKQKMDVDLSRDWDTDYTNINEVCTECGEYLSWTCLWKGERRLCMACTCMVLNAREDHIKDLKTEIIDSD